MIKPKPREAIVIVTPALQSANNGNWRTAERWARFLSLRYDVQLCSSWPLTEQNAHAKRSGNKHLASLLIALHARRSAESIYAWSNARPTQPLVTVLTGTDLYPAIEKDLVALRSLEQSTGLVVLQEQGVAALPANFRAKATVIYQSAKAWKPRLVKPMPFTLRMVGHIRSEKSPETFLKLAQCFTPDNSIRFELIGGVIDPHLGERVREVSNQLSFFSWHGAMSHLATRTRIRNAHLLIHPSQLEGGAHAILEAVMSGTPVLASNVPGNVGMLGKDYLGYFEYGNVQQLKTLVCECQQSYLKGKGLYFELLEQSSSRKALFHPAYEQHTLLRFVKNLLPS